MIDKEVIEQYWDVIVIGSGMGGATAAHSLVEKGYKVLVLEKGQSRFSNENHKNYLNEDNSNERLKHAAWPEKITANVDGIESRFFPLIGCGAGGSTLRYAAALERFGAESFNLKREGEHSDTSWPISYESLIPYYKKAEQLFQVRGTQDPLLKEDSKLLIPPKMSECDEYFFSSFKKIGLNPYRLHVGIEYKESCEECLGYICNKSCKSDANKICLEPAIKSGNLTLVDLCDVIRLESNESEIKEVVCVRDGQEINFKGRVVIMAAGAYFTPVLLLNSSNQHWCNGLGNKFDQVGRNLMFHISDFIAVWPKGKYSRKGPGKSISVRDFYFYKGKSLGVFQSTGMSAEYGNVVYTLKMQFDRSMWRWLKPVRPFLRVPAYLASVLFGSASIFATVMEDYPYPENRVIADKGEPSGMRFNYTVHEELKARIKLFRKVLKSGLSPHKILVMGGEVSLNYAHPCGTCRMGKSPETSVVDAKCKVHGVDNLYIVDASFMPTSGGINPGLTIAANALRVSEFIGAQLRNNK